MAFDLGFNFRDTVGYVTDQSFCAAALNNEAYPHTYTAANGYSINAGYLNANATGTINRSATNDPRIAGVHYGHTNPTTFKIDLSSGSAPGAGTYTIDMAAGDATAGETEWVIVKDDTTALITVSGVAVAAGHYIDASGADVAATTTWTGATVSKTFASTTCNVVLNEGSTEDFPCLAHFRLTLQDVATLVHRQLMLGVGI